MNKNDEWYTPDYAIIPILKYLKPNSIIWCPFDTKESRFIDVLSGAGHKVIYSHISDGKDFLKAKIRSHIDYIISNPPYSIRDDIFIKLYEFGIPFAMLTNVDGIFDSKKRFNLFSQNNFEIMYFDKRIKFIDGKEGTRNRPMFSTAYICSNVLPKQIIFERLEQ